MCVHVHIHTLALGVGQYKFRCLQRPKESLGSSEAGVTGSYEPSCVGAENKTQVLCKSSMCY